LPSGAFIDQGKAETLKLSVVIPAYKEEEYVETTLCGIDETLRSIQLPSEIIVVLDVVPGDQTATCARKIAETRARIRVLERQGRRGVGDAVRAGIRAARGEIVIIAMGDQSEDPSDIARLISRAREHDVVFTNRFRHGRPSGYPVLKYITNRICNSAVVLLFHIPYTDTTNAFKAYKKTLLDRLDLTSKGFEIFLEMPVKATVLARSTDEIEVHHTVRKKEAPKLSIFKDGHKYARVLFSLLDWTKSVKNLG